MKRNEAIHKFLDECINEINEQVPVDTLPDIFQKEDLDVINYFRRENVWQFISLKYEEIGELLGKK